MGQPKLIVEEHTGYKVGDRLDPATFVLTNRLQRVRLTDVFSPDSKVVVLILFGGGAKEIPEGEEFRGSLWCEDSLDDLSVQRALYHAFKDRHVQFVPVAVPPVYSPERFAWSPDVFLGQPDSSDLFKRAVKSFLKATEVSVLDGTIPFPEVYYEPRFRLAQNHGERQLGPEFGIVHDWQGKLKWHLDGRKYGTPTLWFLDRRGTVLTEPLFGNDYDSEPPNITYGYREAKELLDELLGASSTEPY
jgi:hypothetical protein